jgi:hypothetical protein
MTFNFISLTNFHINVNKTIICSELDTNPIFTQVTTREDFTAYSYCESLKSYKLIKYIVLESESRTLSIQSLSSFVLVCRAHKYIPESVWNNLFTFEMLCFLDKI